jgi:hypothetical protein
MDKERDAGRSYKQIAKMIKETMEKNKKFTLPKRQKEVKDD